MIKLNILQQLTWKEHRSGWSYVLELLEPFHDKTGPLFDGSLDSTFGYLSKEKKDAGLIPFRKSWTGFIHSTANMCPFMDKFQKLDDVLNSPLFLESLPFCKGIFTLSEDLADHLRGRIAVQINSIKHPTEFPDHLFSFQTFQKNKKLVHAGTWLRKISDFLQVSAYGYEKQLLVNPTTIDYLNHELNYYGMGKENQNNIRLIDHLPNEDYDRLFAESIVFCSLCDSSATNTVIECIARNTPILVNRLKSVEEYLGKEYPFYFSDLEEASSKLNNPSLILETSRYLADFKGRDEISKEYFITSFLNSPIIRSVFTEA